jgi:hypothetical protein
MGFMEEDEILALVKKLNEKLDKLLEIQDAQGKKIYWINRIVEEMKKGESK